MSSTDVDRPSHLGTVYSVYTLPCKASKKVDAVDPIRNPYTPNAGASPPQLAGRDDIIEEFQIILRRIASGKTEKGLIVTGLRGVGKTVLLGTFEALAKEERAVVVKHECAKSPGEFTRKLPALTHRALLEVSPKSRWQERAKIAAGVLQGFKGHYDPEGRWSVSYERPSMEAERLTGDFVTDLPDLMEALGAAAAEAGRIVAFLVDEIQFLESDELSALVMAKHRINQRGLPIVLAGAGLPQLPNLTAEAQTYAERMFRWPEIGRLGSEAAAEALVTPAQGEGVEYADAAVRLILEYTEGYPYFLQEYGKAAWDVAEDTTITESDVLEAKQDVEDALDRDFFSLRVGGLSPRDLDYVKALASLGPGEHAPGDIATAMGKKSSSQIGSWTQRLTQRGLIYSSRRGRVAFTVPHFERYVERANL